jgi:hypothetical protein
MRDRRGDEKAQFLGPFPAGELLQRHRERGAVAVHDTLGASGGAAGVADAVDVFGPGNDGQIGAVLYCTGGDQVFAQSGRSQTEHMAQRHFLLLRPQLQRLATLGIACIDHQGGYPGILQHKGLVVQRAQRVQRGLAQAQPSTGDQHDQRLGPVSGEYSQPVLVPQTKRLQGACHALHALAQVGIGPAAVIGQHQGDAIRELFKRCAIGLGDGGAGMQCGQWFFLSARRA